MARGLKTRLVRSAPPPVGSKGMAANGDRPIGAARCRREQYTEGDMPTPPPPPAACVCQRGTQAVSPAGGGALCRGLCSPAASLPSSKVQSLLGASKGLSAEQLEVWNALAAGVVPFFDVTKEQHQKMWDDDLKVCAGLRDRQIGRLCRRTATASSPPPPPGPRPRIAQGRPRSGTTTFRPCSSGPPRKGGSWDLFPPPRASQNECTHMISSRGGGGAARWTENHTKMHEIGCSVHPNVESF